MNQQHRMPSSTGRKLIVRHFKSRTEGGGAMRRTSIEVKYAADLHKQCRNGDITQRSPFFRPKMLARHLLPTGQPRRRHPIERHGVRPRTIVAIASKRTTFLRKYVSPVYLDVCIRVWWRVLPVGYMCWGGDIDRRFCTHGCSVLETYDHCFFSCSVSSSLWQLHYSGWKRILSRRPQWTHVLFGLDLPVSSSHARGAQLLWNVLCCIVMYVLWLTRNDRKHRDVVAPPAHALHARTTTLLRAHCRAILPDIEQDDPELHEELQAVLSSLQLA